MRPTPPPTKRPQAICQARAAARTAALIATLAASLASGTSRATPLPTSTAVSISFQGCAGAQAYGATQLTRSCAPTGRELAVEAGNVTGLLQVRTAATAEGGWAGSAAGTASWGDTWRFLGGATPARAVFSFGVSGQFHLDGTGTGGLSGSNDLLFNVALIPEIYFGNPGSSAQGSVDARQDLLLPGSLQQSLGRSLLLPLSLVGIQVGQGLDLSSSLYVRSAASTARATAQVQAQADFSHTAGFTGVQFFDAAGQDISAQVLWAWDAGTATLAPVPEPPVALLLAAGLGLLHLRRRR